MRCLAALLAFVLPATLCAQEPKLPDAKAFDKLVVDTLREVHNRGADLYNTKKEFEGTYRMYEGALVTVRPLLAHRPAAQKMIDDGLAAAEKEAAAAQKAFRLHEAIEAVRAHLKGDPGKKPDDKKPEEKKPVEKKPKEKKPDDKKADNKKPKNPVSVSGGPGFRGRVTLNGQPLKAGDVIFVSLDKPRPVVITAAIQADGQYAPMEVVSPGKYAVIVKGPNVPEKYQLTTTSALVIDHQGPPAVFDFDLK
jgi:hypothetical protein